MKAWPPLKAELSGQLLLFMMRMTQSKHLKTMLSILSALQAIMTSSNSLRHEPSIKSTETYILAFVKDVSTYVKTLVVKG